MKHLTRLVAFSLMIVAAHTAQAANVSEDEGTGSGYEADRGEKWYDRYQEYWNELKNKDARNCRVGNWQSPIKLATGVHGSKDIPWALELVDMNTKWALKVGENPHTTQLDIWHWGTDIRIKEGGREYLRFSQFHFHHPSEHLLDGVRFPMEMHLVHTGRDGTPKAVIAVFLEIGANTRPQLESLAQFFKKPADVGALAAEPSEARLYNILLPPDRTTDGSVGRRYSFYVGSLTTPECGGNIHWFVMRTPVQVSKEFVEKFKTVYPMNARWPQTLNNREIRRDRVYQPAQYNRQGFPVR